MRRPSFLDRLFVAQMYSTIASAVGPLAFTAACLSYGTNYNRLTRPGMNSGCRFLSGESYVNHAGVEQGALLYASANVNRFYALCSLRIKILRIKGICSTAELSGGSSRSTSVASLDLLGDPFSNQGLVSGEFL